MKTLMGSLGGVIAGLVGAVAWAAIVYFTSYELGIAAIGIGALVGVGVLLGSSHSGGPLLGVMAAIIAVIAIVLGKWAWVSMTMGMKLDDEQMIAGVAGLIIEERREAGQHVRDPHASSQNQSLRSMYPQDIWMEAERRWKAYAPDEREQYRSAPALLNADLHLAYHADKICEERMARGETIDWPSGHDLTTAWRQAHYPSDVWEEAVRWWDSYSPAEQDQYRQRLVREEQRQMQEWRTAARPMMFIYSFSFFDALWVFLAIGAAYQIAASGGSDRREPDQHSPTAY